MTSIYWPGIVVAGAVLLDQICLRRNNIVAHFIIAVIFRPCGLFMVLGHQGGAIRLHQWRYDFGYH